VNARSDWRSALLWLIVGAAALLLLSQVADDYVTSIRSLRDLRWRVAGFAPPGDTADGKAQIEIQNRSTLDLTISQLELYVWYGNVTVGRTYGEAGQRRVAANSSLTLPLDLVLNAGAMTDARARAGGNPQPWALTGSYKVGTPRSDFALLYRLNLEMP